MNIMDTLRKNRLIAILRNIPEDTADLTAIALYDGGIRLVEVTMNTKGSLQMIRRWREKMPNDLKIGAGTVLDLNMAKKAIEAGAEFIISPNVDQNVIEYAKKYNISIFPGAMTPTEIVAAWKAGADAIKVFPAGSLGMKYFKEIQAPLNNIPMIPTGGISLENIKDYLEKGVAGLGVGNSLVDKKLLAEQNFDDLTLRAQRFVDAVKRGKSLV